MRKIISVAYYEILKNIRDIKMLLILIITPIILIFILGRSLDSFLSLKYMEAPVVGYVNIDEGNLSDDFEDFLLMDDIKQLLEIKKFNSKDEAIKAVNEDEISNIIFINHDFSFNLKLKKDSTIELIGQKDLSYVYPIVKNYVNNYNINSVIIENDELPDVLINSVQIERGKINPDNLYPNSMDYYSVQTLLQILLVCGVFGVSIIIRDYNDGLLVRVNSLPVRKYQLIIGRLIGGIVYSFIASIVTILFSYFVYNANWNGNPLIIGAAILLFVIVSVGLGALLGVITKNYMTAFGILGLLTIIFPASAGAFSPKSTVKSISVIAPNHYAKNIIFGTIYNYPNGIIISGFIGLLLMIIVIYGLIILVGGSRKYENI